MKYICNLYKSSIVAKIFIWIPITVLVLSIGVLYGMQNANEQVTNSQGLKISEQAVDIQQASSSTGIQIPGYPIIELDKSSGIASIDLLNPENNPCYFQYTISYSSDDTLLYQSDLIEPGKAINGFQVSDIPSAGTYDIVITINTYSLDDTKSAMNGAQLQAVLNVN